MKNPDAKFHNVYQKIRALIAIANLMVRRVLRFSREL
jgi:hypothetical protein